MRITLLLGFLTLISSGRTTNEVLILKFNRCLAESPVGITIKANSILEEFTFCAKYNFRFLRESLLMGFDEDTHFRMNFEEQLASFKFVGEYFFYNIENLNIKPDKWQNLCISVSISHNQLKIVLNGEILGDEEKVDLSKKKLLINTLWVGGSEPRDLLGSEGERPWFTNQRLEGSLTDVQFWNESLSIDIMKSITKSGTITNNIPVPELFSWLTFKMKSNTSCVQYIMMDEKDVLFQEDSQNSVLIEYLTDLNGPQA